jgi:hypothetical protein
MDRMKLIKQAAEKAQIKRAVTNIATRKAAIKAEMRLHKKLTNSVK